MCVANWAAEARHRAAAGSGRKPEGKPKTAPVWQVSWRQRYAEETHVGQLCPTYQQARTVSITAAEDWLLCGAPHAIP